MKSNSVIAFYSCWILQNLKGDTPKHEPLYQPKLIFWKSTPSRWCWQLELVGTQWGKKTSRTKNIAAAVAVNRSSICYSELQSCLVVSSNLSSSAWISARTSSCPRRRRILALEIATVEAKKQQKHQLIFPQFLEWHSGGHNLDQYNINNDDDSNDNNVICSSNKDGKE